MTLRMLLIIAFVSPTSGAWANVDSLLAAASDTARAFDERVLLLKAAAQRDTSARAAHALGAL